MQEISRRLLSLSCFVFQRFLDQYASGDFVGKVSEYCALQNDFQHPQVKLITCFQFARHNNSTLSVSGFDGNVYLYETQQWTQEQSSRAVVKPEFVHRGHEVCLDDFQGILTVLHHSWHPSQTQLVLSAASDGSLHAWNYHTQSGSSSSRSNNDDDSQS